MIEERAYEHNFGNLKTYAVVIRISLFAHFDWRVIATKTICKHTQVYEITSDYGNAL